MNACEPSLQFRIPVRQPFLHLLAVVDILILCLLYDAAYSIVSMFQIIGLLMNKELKKDMQGGGHGLV
jgi:hypothetical protein